jgi:hypothetical protein
LDKLLRFFGKGSVKRALRKGPRHETRNQSGERAGGDRGACGRLFPEPRVQGRSPIDPPGVLLSTVGLAYLVYGIIRALDIE